jgi:hypothetical protein
VVGAVAHARAVLAGVVAAGECRIDCVSGMSHPT